jgi:predicted component of type VI protein secretion system
VALLRGEPETVATEHRTAARGALVHAARRVSVGPDGLLVGRAGHCDLVLDTDGISRAHARIDPRGDGFELTDLGSTNGTWVDGERVGSEPVVLHPGAEIVVGAERLLWVIVDATVAAWPSGEAVAAARVVGFDGRRLTIGRDPGNDVPLDDPNVSRWHAEVVACDGRVELTTSARATAPGSTDS